MRFANTLSLALAIALLQINFALGADSPVYSNGLLTIPSINTADQVGKYQDVTFKFTEQGLWQLVSLKAIGTVIGTSVLGLPHIETVDVVKTDTFPTQVFLRVSGGFSPCNNSTLGQINQRLGNNQFDISITVNSVVSVPPTACLPYIATFVKTVALPVYGLRAGIYSYDVNGTKGTFELAADNLLPGDTTLIN
ncbi:MAG: hypothetical protein ACYC2R_14955 [Burkholderiales bacterium]